MAATTPQAEQIRMVLFGLRNAGKSSLLNLLFEKEVVIVSDTPGTTTDPVTRSIELGPLGPVAVTDTAGLDDTGELGLQRVEKTRQRIDSADFPVLVVRLDRRVTAEEMLLYETLSQKKPGTVIAATFADATADQETEKWLEGKPHCRLDNKNGKGLIELKNLLMSRSALIEREISPLEGLVKENDLLVLVTPIDLAAPKGRLIMPQVETIRDALDRDCASLILKERELSEFYPLLKRRPELVICDSQAFNKVAADLPEDQPLTSFSIIFARKKGDLSLYVQGVKKLQNVPAGAKVLILESCSHHRQADDIGTVKIPRLFRQLAQPRVEFDFARELPPEEKLKDYFMVINCAGCMASRGQIMARVDVMRRHQVHVTNYGLFLAWANGLLPRALQPFPLEYAAWLNS